MEKKKKVTQTDIVLSHLQSCSGITSYEAFEKYGITRLSAKIFILREKGYKIINRNIEHINKQGEKTHFVEYRLVKG